MAFSSLLVLDPLLFSPSFDCAMRSGCANQPTDFVTKSEKLDTCSRGQHSGVAHIRFLEFLWVCDPPIGMNALIRFIDSKLGHGATFDGV